jgi:hypothetical protein
LQPVGLHRRHGGQKRSRGVTELHP